MIVEAYEYDLLHLSVAPLGICPCHGTIPKPTHDTWNHMTHETVNAVELEPVLPNQFGVPQTLSVESLKIQASYGGRGRHTAIFRHGNSFQR